MKLDETIQQLKDYLEDSPRSDVHIDFSLEEASYILRWLEDLRRYRRRDYIFAAEEEFFNE